jgi:hypothetical protein
LHLQLDGGAEQRVGVVEVPEHGADRQTGSVRNVLCARSGTRLAKQVEHGGDDRFPRPLGAGVAAIGSHAATIS